VKSRPTRASPRSRPDAFCRRVQGGGAAAECGCRLRDVRRGVLGNGRPVDANAPRFVRRHMTPVNFAGGLCRFVSFQLPRSGVGFLKWKSQRLGSSRSDASSARLEAVLRAEAYV
jgi:hypothetical protein